jgi:Ca2+-binding RTX toxin-like protein
MTGTGLWAHVAEGLEQRRLLSGAWLDGQTVRVEGTNGDDVVSIGWRPGSNTTRGGYIVTINSDVYRFRRGTGDSGVQSFDIKLRRGDDSFEVTNPDEVYLPLAIYAGTGNDTVSGGLKRNLVYGGTGDDSIQSFGKADTLYGEAGNDTLQSGEGPAGGAYLDGGPDNDSLVGGDGDDEIHGAAGADTIEGNGGVDTLYGEQNNDLIHGGDGDDELYGNDGRDTLYGGAGNDYLIGNAGRNEVHGEDDNDHLVSLAAAIDLLDGGSGDNRVDFQRRQDTVVPQ